MRLAEAIGKTFNHLLVVKKSRAGTSYKRGGKKLHVLVRCVYNGCGEEFEARLDNVANGRTKSCGCAPRDVKIGKRRRTIVGKWEAADEAAEIT